MYNEGIIINSNGNLISGQTWAIQSHQAESDLAYRGDSLLYSVKVNILDDGLDIKMEHIYAVSNYRKANTGMVIIDLSKLKEYDFLSPAWLAYYERRRILMKPFMDGVIRA